MTDDDDDDCCGLLASVWRVKLSNGREEVCQVDVALRCVAKREIIKNS